MQDNKPVYRSRREFLERGSLGLGAIALSNLLHESQATASPAENGQAALVTAAAGAKAKRVIYLFQSGGPSHLDLFDPKPETADMFDKDIPDSIFGTQRISGMVANQSRFPYVPTMYEFAPGGKCGTSISNMLPHTREIVDDICVVRSMHTEAINHDPAITFLQTGSQLPGRPSIGAWLDYGLGSLNSELPSFVVMTSVPSSGTAGQGLLSRLWGTGFLPSQHQGVQLRNGNNPVLYLKNPEGMPASARRSYLDGLRQLNEAALAVSGDPEIDTRISQYEMAYRMQTSVPELADLSNEPQSTFDLYGEEARQPGTFARNCLMARRLAEQDVRFIQLYHRGWDHHGSLPSQMKTLTGDTDRASAALVTDLKQRGLLDDTLVIWGGEFGRTPYAQGSPKPDQYGRDHHGKAFSIWMAGGGIRAGITFGETDAFGFNIVENPIHVHDLHATILHLLGVDHKKLTYRFQGRQYRLTDVHGLVANEILA